MRRLLATAVWDVRLQFRQGFYYATAFVVVVWIGLLGAVGREGLALLLPVIVLSNVLTNTFYFLGGLVLLEKREGTLEAQVVTPLRSGEYLASKVLTLALLSVLENVTLVLLTFGAHVPWPALIAGVVVGAAILAPFGFLAVARYDSVNEYLLPSVVYASLLGWPMLPYFGIGDHWLTWLHPVQPALELLRSAFVDAEPWRYAYGLLYGGACAGAVCWLATRSFVRFIVAREGARR